MEILLAELLGEGPTVVVDGHAPAIFTRRLAGAVADDEVDSIGVALRVVVAVDREHLEVLSEALLKRLDELLCADGAAADNHDLAHFLLPGC